MKGNICALYLHFDFQTFIYIYTYIPSENNKLLRTYCIINILLTFTYSKPTF